MKVEEYVSLAPFTTLGIGGTARFFIEAKREEDVHEAVQFAQERSLPLLTLGMGSNLLVPDTRIEAVVLEVSIDGIEVKETADEVIIVAGA